MSSQKAMIKKKVKKHIPKDWLCELRILYRLTKKQFLMFIEQVLLIWLLLPLWLQY